MARTPRKHPKPNLRERNGRYELRWYWKGSLYEIRLGGIPKHNAIIIRDATAVALAGAASFPEEIANEPTLKRFLELQEGITADDSDTSLIATYILHLKAQNPASSWPAIVKGHLQRALEHIGTIQNATARELQTFLDALALKTSGATSNRAHTALSGFFTFLRTTGHHPKNFKPLGNISKKKRGKAGRRHHHLGEQ